MKFNGETVTCEACGIEFNKDDDCRHPDADEPLCPVCASKEYNSWLNSPCKLCRKPMRNEPDGSFYNCDSDSAHKSCVKKLSDKQIEDQEWTDEYP